MKPRWQRLLSRHGAAATVWLLAWAAMFALDGHLDLANLAMLLVLAAALAGLWLPPWVSAPVCALSVLAFNWFFVPPRGTFSVDLYQHALLLVTMLAVAWIVSALVARERALAKRARVAADQAQDLRAPLATLHERNVILTVDFRDVPWVDDAERVSVEALAPGFWRVRAAFGFMEPPDVPRALALAAPQGLVLPMFETSYLLSRETVVPGAARGGMALWRERLFAAMSRASSGVAGFFRLPDNAVVELGTRVQI